MADVKEMSVFVAAPDVGTVISGSVGSVEFGEEERGRGKRKKSQPSDEPAQKRRTRASFHVMTGSSSSQTGNEETHQV